MYHGEARPEAGTERYETAVLWFLRAAVRGVARELRCTAEHLGEDFFELCLVVDDELLLREPFRDVERLVERAEELRARTEAQGAFP